MTDMNTQKRHAQYRGPTTSDDYNARIEENYKDLVSLYNQIGLNDYDMNHVYGRLAREQWALMNMVESLEARLDSLEYLKDRLSFSNANQVDISRFDSTTYEITAADVCTHDPFYGLVTLPRVETNSFSQLKLTNQDDNAVVSPSLEFVLEPVISTAEIGASIDTSNFYNCVTERDGRVWERNVSVDSPHMNGSKIDVLIQVPNDVSPAAESNVIKLNPYPAMGVNLTDVSVNYDENQFIDTRAGSHEPLNSIPLYAQQENAVGWVPPGGWAGDEMLNAAPKAFYFEPGVVSSIKLRLEADNYMLDSLTNKYVYTYGLAGLDVKYESFLETGKTIIRFDAPTGGTISSVDSVNPEIWNISPVEIPSVFSYRVIWETSYDSGSYTTEPVPFSKRVWIEVTMNKSANKTSPALSGLLVDYS